METQRTLVVGNSDKIHIAYVNADYPRQLIAECGVGVKQGGRSVLRQALATEATCATCIKREAVRGVKQ